MLQVHFQEDVVHNFEQGRFSAAILTMGRLQIRIDFIDDHVLVPFLFLNYSLFYELRDVLQIVDWSNTLKNQVKSKLLQQRMN